MFKHSQFIFWQLAAVLAMVCTCSTIMADAGKMILVENGKAKATIVVFKEAPYMTRVAANDLATYIEKVSGARPEVIEGWPEPMPEHAIWVGYQKGLEKLFPKVDFDFKHPEEILIAANENHLVIAGRDKWDPEHLDLPANLVGDGNSRAPVVRGVQQEYGTVNAVFTFLHDQLGVRWLWPGEVEFPSHATVALSPFVYRYHPQMRSRMQIFWHLGRGRNGQVGRPDSDWVRFNRLQLDSLDANAGGHGFVDWWERFGKTHPEYFALQADGTRSGYPGGRTAKICESSPAVWEQWLKDVDAALVKNPTQVSFNAAANDYWNAGHCICENCRAWDDLNAPRRMFSWQGLTQEYVALSDRQVRFGNALGRLLKERYPDRNYYVVIHAYGLSRSAPISAVPDDNVMISSVACFLFNPYQVDRASEGTKDIDQFKAWGKVTSLLYSRPNVTSNVQAGVPLSTRFIGEYFQVMAQTGAIGLFVDTIYNHWALCGPSYYLMAQLAWNPQLDYNAVMDDYFQLGFGPAADQLKQYQSLLDDARKLHLDHGNGVDGAAWAQAYSPEFFNKSEALMKQAATNANGQEKYVRRVEYITAGLTFLKLQTQSRVLADQVKAGENKADALVQMTQNWQRIEMIAKEYPYAIHPLFLTTIRKKPALINPAAYK